MYFLCNQITTYFSQSSYYPKNYVELRIDNSYKKLRFMTSKTMLTKLPKLR